MHVLDEDRGAALEAVVSRLKMLAKHPDLQNSPIAHIRFVAASATIPVRGLPALTWRPLTVLIRPFVMPQVQHMHRNHTQENCKDVAARESFHR